MAFFSYVEALYVPETYKTKGTVINPPGFFFITNFPRFSLRNFFSAYIRMHFVGLLNKIFFSISRMKPSCVTGSLNL